MKNNDIGNAIRAYFRGQNMTLTQVVERLGVTLPAVTNLLNGTRNFGRSTAQKWHEAFGFNIDYLMSGTGSLVGDPEPEKEGIYIPAETQEMYTAMAQSIRQLSEIVNRLTAQKAVRLKGGGIPFLDGLEYGV